MWSDQQISEWQQKDADIKKIIVLKSMFQNKPAKQYVEGTSYSCRVLWSLLEVLTVLNNILYYLFECENGDMNVLLIAPSEIRKQIMQHLHNARTAGHLGRDKTINSVKKRFFWSGMTSDISQWCKACNSCAMAKSGPGLGKFPLQQSKVGAPF